MNTQKIRNLLLGALAGATILLVVAAESGGREVWEYKVADSSGNTKDAIEPFLNNMAKEGWVFVQRDSSGWFYFKRAK